MRHDHILVSLKVIGALQEGQKLSTRNGLLTIDSRPSPFMRWLAGDNRLTTLIYVINVVNEAIVAGFRQELVDAIPGMKALKVTYSSDASTVASIEHTINKMNGIY